MDLAEEAGRIGMCSIIYTNIGKDGMMDGPDIRRTKAIAEASGLPVVLSGGVSSMSDIEEVSRENDGKIVGIITGKAVYEGKIDLLEAVAKFQDDSIKEEIW
jgi:phosphoribosylformimino-5-aminoimidazole carboxamide ribotide isomerase